MIGGWKRPFDDPIRLPRGRHLITLGDAGTYITKLPKAEHEAQEWQAAMEALILVATSGGPTMFARIGLMRALNRNCKTDQANRGLSSTKGTEAGYQVRTPALKGTNMVHSANDNDPALLRSLINRCESGEPNFQEGRPRCHCAIWRAPRALSGC